MTRVIALFIGLAVVLTAGAGYAQLRDDANLLTGNISYVLAKSADTEETKDGAGFGFIYEKVHDNRQWSFGFGLSLQKAEESFTEDSVDYRSNYSNFDVSLRMRFFGAPESRITPYIGLGLGVRFSGVSLATATDDIDDSSNGLSVTVPIGLLFFVSDSVYLDASYTYNFLGNSKYVANNMQHLFSLGIGVQLGS
jgi:opacity protein-like surface antigen